MFERRLIEQLIDMFWSCGIIAWCLFGNDKRNPQKDVTSSTSERGRWKFWKVRSVFMASEEQRVTTGLYPLQRPLLAGYNSVLNNGFGAGSQQELDSTELVWAKPYCKQSRRHHENWVDHPYTHFNFTTHYSIIGSVHDIHDVERALLHPWKGLALSGGENDPRSLKVETYVSRWWRRRTDKKIFAQVKGRRVFESVPCVHTFMIIYVYTYCFPMLTTCITYENQKSQINSCRMYIKGDAWRTIVPGIFTIKSAFRRQNKLYTLDLDLNLHVLPKTAMP